jgi:hypothetical protein
LISSVGPIGNTVVVEDSPAVRAGAAGDVGNEVVVIATEDTPIDLVQPPRGVGELELTGVNSYSNTTIGEKLEE